MRTRYCLYDCLDIFGTVGMKPLSERDENLSSIREPLFILPDVVGMKPLSERDENYYLKNVP